MATKATTASGAVGGLGTSLGSVGQIASGFVVGQALDRLPGMLLDAAKSAAEDARAMAQLQQALHGASGAYDVNLQKVEARIAAGQELGFTDDQIRDSFRQLLVATGDVDEALRRQAVAMDVARGSGRTLEQTSVLVSRVTEDNVQAFRRMGIVINDTSSEAAALAEVQGRFAGQADQYAQSTAGQFEVASIKIDELKESVGARLMPVMASAAAQLNTEVIPALSETFDSLSPAFDQMGVQVGAVFQGISAIVSGGLGVISGVVKTFTSVLSGDWSGAWEGLKDIASGALNVVSGLVDGLIKSMTFGALDWDSAWSGAKAAATAAWDIIKDTVSGAWDAITGAVSTGISSVVGFFTALPGNIVAGIGNLTQTLTGIGKDLISGLISGIGNMVGAVVSAIWKLKDEAISGLGNAADWLYNIGADIVRGLINGIRSMFGAVTDVLGDLTDMIPIHKGPPEKDRVLLYDTGRMIMEGLIDGVESQIPHLQNTLGVVTGVFDGGIAPNGLGVAYIQNPWGQFHSGSQDALGGTTTGGSWGTMPGLGGGNPDLSQFHLTPSDFLRPWAPGDGSVAGSVFSQWRGPAPMSREQLAQQQWQQYGHVDPYAQLHLQFMRDAGMADTFGLYQYLPKPQPKLGQTGAEGGMVGGGGVTVVINVHGSLYGSGGINELAHAVQDELVKVFY